MRRVLATALLVPAAACGAAHSDAGPARHVHAEFAASATLTAAPPTAPPISAGDVAAAVPPDRDAAAIAALRASGPPALARLLADFDRAPPGAARDGLAATIDKVAGQRFATVSRLYWYTDLPAAEAAARASGKPILSLRMLGRLDEDLSCANSRFFRTVLYANREVAALLRDRFVLHWSSERAVPKVTIDFGDGRTLQRTITGNSAHYILDDRGRPLDVLPGLYAPKAFRAELARSLALAATVAPLDGAARDAAIVAYHQARLAERAADWQKLGPVPVIYGRRGLLGAADVDGALATAQRATMSKAFVEVPDLRVVDVGADPGALAPDVELWAVIGQRLFGLGPAVPAVAAPTAVVSPNGFGLPAPEPARRRAGAPAAPTAQLGLLDAPSRALIDALLTSAPADPRVPTLDAAARDRVVAQLEQTLAADSALDELQLRQQIHVYFAAAVGPTDFATLNAWIYASVFHTPADDAWLGLLPRTAFTGLPGDGVVIPR